jgi:hypothetical protein
MIYISGEEFIEVKVGLYTLGICEFTTGNSFKVDSFCRLA